MYVRNTIEVFNTQSVEDISAAVSRPEVTNDALKTHEQCIEDFYAAWKLPEDAATRQVANYFDVMVKARDQIEHTMWPRLGIVMRQYLWLHFSDSGDLPANIALARPSDNPEIDSNRTTLVALDTPMHPNDLSVLSWELKQHGLSELEDDRRSIQWNPRSIKTYYQVVITSPQYTFLQSLGKEQTAANQRPLTLLEKQHAAAAAEATVRQKYGLTPEADLRTAGAPNATQELSRRICQLDEETMLEKLMPQTALEAARQFIKNDMRQLCDSSADVSHYGLDNSAVFCDFRDSYLLRKYCEMLNTRLGGGPADIFDGRRLILNQIVNLFNPFTTSPKFSLSCEDTSVEMRSMMDKFTPEAIIRMCGGQPKYVQGIKYDNTLQPIQLIRHQIIFPQERGEYNCNPSVTSREEFERRKNQIMMTAQRKATTVDMVPMRLITFPDLSLPLPEPTAAEIEHADLILEYQDDNNRTAQVAGYELFAIEESKLYFRKNADDDPERPATAPIATEGRQRIIEDLKYLGVTAPLKALSKRNLTVDGLAKALREASDYTFDQVGDGQHQLIPGVRLDQGRLQLQCDGAAFMLRRALNLAFESSAQVVSGLVLKPNNLVSAAAHDKVLWTDGQGQEFYLDATPRYGQGEESASSLRRPRTRRFSCLVGRTMLRQTESPNTPRENTSATLPTSALEKVVSHSIIETLPQAKPLKQQLEQQLYPLFKVATVDELYKKVAALTADDPIRRTAEAVIQAQQGTLEPKAVEQLAGYLGNLEASDDATLKKLGVPKYDASTLRLMLTFVQRLLSEGKL